MEYIDKYLAMAIQPEVRTHYYTGRDPKVQKMENVKHYCDLIDRFKIGAEHRWGGMPVKLCLFPESFLHGFGPARTRDFKVSMECAITIPGPEIEMLAEKAIQHDIYIAGAAFEILPEFPDRFFNTGFIISPKGEVILKYRKINTSNNDFELSTSPHDVLDKYGDDPKKLFPVVETEIGNLGMYICYDGTFPEIARCLALNGAEIFMRPNMWAYGTTEATELMTMHNRMRAFENMAYLVTCNWARSPMAEYESSCGHAMIVDYTGRVLTEKMSNDESFVCDVIDLKALRDHRRNAKFGNFFVQLRADIYVKSYQNYVGWAKNQWMARPPLQNLDEKWNMYKPIIDRLVSEGILK